MEERVELYGEDPEDPHSQAAGTVYCPLDVDDVPVAGGSRPHRLLDVSGPQERVQWHTLEQIDDSVLVVPLLHTFVPQTVDQQVEVLRLIDTVVPEQVIDVPKITSQDVIPQRAVLRVPQMAEQLVDEPMPSFDDFELVEEEEEEDEQQQPSLVPESYFRDDFGRVCGPEGVYWWMIGTSTVQWPSGGVHRQARAV